MAYARPRRRRTYRKKASRSRGRKSFRRSRASSGRTRSRRMPGRSTKSLLNLTSRKKRDTMLNYTNITASAPTGGLTYLLQPAILTGGSAVPSFVLWCATARPPTVDATRFGTVIDAATRTASTCYMRGLAENLEIQVTDGMPWQWRRICFTYKNMRNAHPPVVDSGFEYGQLTTSGVVRTMNQPTGLLRDDLMGLIFKGARGADWQSEMIAPLDTTRISVKYDKTLTIASGNDDGLIRKYKRWHGMNSNLVYNDDEQGGDVTLDVSFSVSSKPGMGDYFVADFFQARQGSTTANQLSFGATSTLYWHEK
ncbi:MAG: capsid protein [Genomoviridae sp.]|nr:MAG: capsid protein [Genomoviridae sp.]